MSTTTRPSGGTNIKSRAEAARLLLKHGADQMVKGMNGNTALDLAEDHKQYKSFWKLRKERLSSSKSQTENNQIADIRECFLFFLHRGRADMAC